MTVIKFAFNSYCQGQVMKQDVNADITEVNINCNIGDNRLNLEHKQMADRDQMSHMLFEIYRIYYKTNS